MFDCSNTDLRSRWRMAEDPFTSSEVLAVLSKDINESVRSRVAENPSTAPDVLTFLSKDNYVVRWYLARNPSIPMEILNLLVQDDDSDVRWQAIKNPSIPYGFWIPSPELTIRLF